MRWILASFRSSGQLCLLYSSSASWSQASLSYHPQGTVRWACPSVNVSTTHTDKLGRHIHGCIRCHVLEALGSSGLNDSEVLIGLEATVLSFWKCRFARFALHDHCRFWVFRMGLWHHLDNGHSNSCHVLESDVFQFPTVFEIIRKGLTS